VSRAGWLAGWPSWAQGSLAMACQSRRRIVVLLTDISYIERHPYADLDESRKLLVISGVITYCGLIFTHNSGGYRFTVHLSVTPTCADCVA